MGWQQNTQSLSPDKKATLVVGGRCIVCSLGVVQSALGGVGLPLKAAALQQPLTLLFIIWSVLYLQWVCETPGELGCCGLL